MKHLKYFILSIISILILSSYGVYKSSFFEIAKQIEIFTAMYKEINMNYVDELNPADLMNTAITSMLKDLDPYTNYYNEQDIENAKILKSANYTNLGFQLKVHNNMVIVTDVLKGFAADKAGLKLADQLLSIDGSPVEEFKANLGQILNGAPNTSSVLQIKRKNKTQTINLKRLLNKPSAVPFFGMATNDTGYIVLSKFTSTASKDVGLALLQLKDKGAKKLILDLRNNPGGLLTEAVNIVNIFVPRDQLVVYTKSKIEAYNKSYATKKEPIDTEIPLVVLINSSSASASEIVSGSLQDLDRAVVMGARSFGKGLVQRPKPLKYGTQVKITISRYYLPSGRGIQALTYENGVSIRKSTNKAQEFSTKAGRKVYDAGGINPDLKIEQEQVNSFVNKLEEDLVIFNFATQYYQNNPTLDWNTFTVDDKVYNQFLAYVKSSNYQIKTLSDEKIDDLISSSIEDNFDKSFVKKLERLKSDIQSEKIDLFTNYKTQISNLLTNQIIKYYAYDDGVFLHTIENAAIINEATKILDNNLAYNAILKP